MPACVYDDNLVLTMLIWYFWWPHLIPALWNHTGVWFLAFRILCKILRVAFLPSCRTHKSVVDSILLLCQRCSLLFVSMHCWNQGGWSFCMGSWRHVRDSITSERAFLTALVILKQHRILSFQRFLLANHGIPLGVISKVMMLITN